MGRVSSMRVVFILSYAEFGPNDHGEYALPLYQGIVEVGSVKYTMRK